MFCKLQIVGREPRKRVMEVMARQGVNLSSLAARVGRSPGYLSQVLSGQKPGSVDLWDRISQALGVSGEALRHNGEAIPDVPDFRPDKMDPRLREVLDFLVAKWPELDADQRGEVRMTLRRILPGFEEWLKQRG